MLRLGRRVPALLRSIRTEPADPIDETVKEFLPPKAFYAQLKSRGMDFFTGVPDSLLKDFNSYILDNVPENRHIIAANEGAAVAIAAGYHLASRKFPVVYLQNSGLGNVVNPLLSLVDSRIYKIPILFLIGWRGEPGTKDEPQHTVQGQVMNNLMTDLGLAYQVLPDYEDGAAAALDLAVYHMRSRGSSYAFLVRRETFLKYKGLKSVKLDLPINRERAIQLLLAKTDRYDAFVATTGFTSRELYELREQSSQSHEQDFYVVGSMGHASSIAMGIALSKPSKNVYCLDGDGAVLMHMGALAQAGARLLPNYRHILLNNSSHDSVGGQPTVSPGMDYVMLAKACGYQYAATATTEADMVARLSEVTKTQGPAFLELKVCRKTRDNLGRPKSTPRDNKEAFMTFLES